MKWDECVAAAKEELGVVGYTQNWNEVIDLAKKKYWEGKTFKRLKERTIARAGGKCKFCDNPEEITAHHITYGEVEYTICLCSVCHDFIHWKEYQDYGKILEIVLINWNRFDWFMKSYPNCEEMPVILECRNKIKKQIKEVKEQYEEDEEIF